MNRYKFLIIIFGLLFIFLITSCQPQATKTNEPIGSYPATNSIITPDSTGRNDISTPQSGNATVIGSVSHSKTGAPFIDTTIRLAEVYGEGDNQNFVLDGAHSPAGVTDSNGNFVISNIPARKYVLIVGDSTDSNNYVIIHDSNGRAIVYNAEANKITDVGKISIELPYN